MSGVTDEVVVTKVRKWRRLMVVKVFTIYDSKTEAYLPPFYMKSKGEAIRALQNHVNDVEHNFCKYASDFTLFDLGTWDDSTCKFDLLNTPHSILILQELKRDVVPA